MGDRTVTTLEKVVGDGFPVCVDLIGQSMGESKLIDAWGVLVNFVCKITGLTDECFGIWIHIYKHQTTEYLHLYVVEADFILVKLLDVV